MSICGYTTKEGNCYVRNSNPNPLIFLVTDWSENEITGIVAGYGAYRDNSNIYVKLPKLTSIPIKNHSKLNKIVINAGGIQEEISASSLLNISTDYEKISFVDPFMGSKNDFVEVSFVDSRGNKTSVRKQIKVDTLILPQVTKFNFKRDNGIDTKTKLMLERNARNI